MNFERCMVGITIFCLVVAGVGYSGMNKHERFVTVEVDGVQLTEDSVMLLRLKILFVNPNISPATVESFSYELLVEDTPASYVSEQPMEILYPFSSHYYYAEHAFPDASLVVGRQISVAGAAVVSGETLPIRTSFFIRPPG